MKIIAEAGVNHDGSLSKALRLIDAAKFAGADIVKFQTFDAKEIVTRDVQLTKYQEKIINSKIKKQYELLKKLQLTKKDFIKLKDYSEKVGIEFLTTGFGIESLNFIKKLNLQYTKIPSGEMLNVPYLIKASEFSKTLLISTGMSNIEEISFTLKILRDCKFDFKKIILMQCTTMYPTKINFLNLKVIETFKSKFKLRLGFSDHSTNLDAPILAYGLGAEIIEKHLTLNENDIGPDHKSSLNPSQFKLMITKLRNMEKAMGTGIKKSYKRRIKEFCPHTAKNYL